MLVEFFETLCLERKTDDCRIYPKFFRSNFRSEKQLTLHNGSFLKARNRPFFTLNSKKLDITSYLISIDVNSTLYDEVMHQFKIHLNVNIKMVTFLKCLILNKDKVIHRSINTINSTQKLL